MLDSGATDSCAQDCKCPEVQRRSSEGSRTGQMYTAAGGNEITNEGQKDIRVVTANSVIQTNWQITDITGPLSSVRQICLQGGTVLFTAQGGITFNIENGQETPFGIEDNICPVVITELLSELWTAGMSHSSVDDSERQTCRDERGERELHGQEEEHEDVKETREGQTRAPKCPSADQTRVHKPTHRPFRSWCPQCVAGKAKSWCHCRQEADDDGGVPTISFDHCFLRDSLGGESVLP